MFCSESNSQPQTETVVSCAARKTEVKSQSPQTYNKGVCRYYINLSCSQEECLIYDREFN